MDIFAMARDSHERAERGESEILPVDFLELLETEECEEAINQFRRKGRNNNISFSDSMFLIIEGSYARRVCPSSELEDFRIYLGEKEGIKDMRQLRDVCKSLPALMYLEEYEGIHSYDHFYWSDSLREHVSAIKASRENTALKIQASEELHLIRASVANDKAKKLARNEAQLYRHFDKEGQLLYVGISCNHVTRLSQHRSNSSWFPLIASITIEQFKTKSDAEKAERIAIVKERPIFNRAHNRLAYLDCQEAA